MKINGLGTTDLNIKWSEGATQIKIRVEIAQLDWIVSLEAKKMWMGMCW